MDALCLGTLLCQAPVKRKGVPRLELRFKLIILETGEEEEFEEKLKVPKVETGRTLYMSRSRSEPGALPF